ncbi:MAG: pyridoxal phosphate-dependent aminotransferase [Candidatus Bathyarchaeota archaeon]
MPSDDILNSPTIDKMVNSLNRKWQTYPKDVIPMWLASPDFPILPEIKEALHKAVDDEDLYYNSDIKPRTTIAEKIKRVNKIEVTPNDVMISQGVEPILWFAVKHACREGEEVVLPNPMYNGFLHAVHDIKVKPVYWDLDFEDGYKFDLEKLKEIVNRKTKLICLCNPHNPAGRVMTREELKGVADIAVDYRIRVFVDELWEDIRFDGRKHISFASLNPEIENLTATAWGVSKTFGVAGLYLGYMATTNKDMFADYKKIAQLVQRGSNTLARAVAPIMLDETLDWWRRDLMNHLTKIRELCVRRMNNIPNVKFPKIEGTYMAFPRFDIGMKCEEIHEYLLKEAKVGLSMGTSFGPLGEHHMRICLATSKAIMNEAIDRMENALTKLSP